MGIIGNKKTIIEQKEQISEKEYRNLPVNSSSSLKDFATDRKKYYKKYVAGENVEDEDNKAMLIGSVVDCLLFEESEFDNRYYKSTIDSVPTGLMLDFVNNLIKSTNLSKDEDGMVTKDFIDIAKEAYENTDFKRDKFETVITKFVGSDAEMFYKEKRDSIGKIVICMQDIENAERIKESLRNFPNTAEWINRESDREWTILKQLKIEEFEIDGLPLKAMLDLITVNHLEKWIQPDDLKCTWSVEGFLEEYYLYRKAYIQAFVYHQALASRTVDLGFDYSEYEIKPIRFIVCDSINYMQPIIYTLSQEDLQNAYIGFSYKNREYIGVRDTIKGLKFALQENVWNISYKNYINKGITKLFK